MRPEKGKSGKIQNSIKLKNWQCANIFYSLAAPLYFIYLSKNINKYSIRHANVLFAPFVSITLANRLPENIKNLFYYILHVNKVD